MTVDKLAAEQVQAIRKDPRSYKLISREYKLTISDVYNIKHKQVWAGVEGEVVLGNARYRRWTDDEIRAIRSDPRGARAIARELGIGANAVSYIKQRRTHARVADI